ncbi:HAMP domain-containing histidine kinase [Clostridioides mangenotii]|uniref:sensor histidine kinase n=1 Tax=Metaclostridioides mangenotii TaxID=1540 RepID=UPI00214A28FF|nr:HAMP domain-containing sensor histidine kinase [Clostridioides mangenotii]MCR1954470.1 HAMP domain-containing histidine kinase [Clostridioides mangenotii]
MINKNIFSETKNHLIKMYILVVGSFMIIFSFFIFIYFTAMTYSGVDNEIKSEFNNIIIQLKSTSFFDPIRLEDPKDMVYVYENDRIRYYTQNEYFDEILPNIESEKINGFYKYTKNGHTFRALSVVEGKYKIQIIRNIDSELNSRRQITSGLLIAILVFIVITYFVAVYLTRKALIPIENVWKNQAKFIQDASHELRTPITIVSSKLESMLKHPENTVNDEVEKIAVVMKETRKIKKMINDLLSLSKEDTIINIHLKEVDLVSLINEISNDYLDIAKIQDKKFEILSEFEELSIQTDREKLRECILILIDNAFKYTTIGDSISIELKESFAKGGVSILIKDTGCGIKESELPYIYDRFFRSENVRDKDIDGSGIGLSIAKMISKNLSIKINVRSKLGEGTEFELLVPYNNL